jgi:16S rRNA (guanine966-N2)-methyltransferase
MPPVAPPNTPKASLVANRTVYILSGQYKNRKISVPDAPDLRPSCHRIRGAIFNTLIHRFYPHTIGQKLPLSGLKIADLYAGTGAYGLEALSLGASHATFVESHGPTAHHLRATLNALKADGQSQVLTTTWPSKTPTTSLGLTGADFDLVFLDPPYQIEPLALEQALEAAGRIVKQGGLIVLEHPRLIQKTSGLTLVHSKKWGLKASGFYRHGVLNEDAQAQ